MVAVQGLGWRRRIVGQLDGPGEGLLTRISGIAGFHLGTGWGSRDSGSLNSQGLVLTELYYV